jgi:hypothetical protein
LFAQAPGKSKDSSFGAEHDDRMRQSSAEHDDYICQQRAKNDAADLLIESYRKILNI